MARAHPHRSPQPLPQPVFAEPVFAEGTVTPDPTAFLTPHPSDSAQYAALGDLISRDAVSFDSSRLAAGDLFPFTTALGPAGADVAQRIRMAGKIVFHAVGDSGAADVRRYKSEIRVADQIAEDCNVGPVEDRPSFLLHLGDLVYSFGESAFYFDQFYDPFRNYPRPIFALAGNHDSFIIPGTAAADEPLKTFMRNFCAESLTITPEARSLHRTAQMQPGVYFTLDAPYVRIICLFSNALEDPGLISSESGRWPGVPDVQLEFLTAQLRRVRAEAYAGAVLLATHHPAFSYIPPAGQGGGGNHGGSPAMLRQIDAICKAEGVYPHAVLAAHAHNYQRYTRTVQLGGREFDVPFVVCGSGGHNINPLTRSRRGHPATEPLFGADVTYLDRDPAIETSGLVLEKYDDRNYGYLQVSADARRLRIGFYRADTNGPTQSRFDLVTVDLASHTLVAN